MRKQAEQIIERLSTDNQFMKSFQMAICNKKEAVFFEENGLELKIDAAKRLIMEAIIKKQIESGELTEEELDRVSGGQELCYHNCMAVLNDEVVCKATCYA